MTYRSSSSADFFDREEREEMRFLRALKGTLREAAAAAQDEGQLTQEQLAERLGYDPAQLSRLLSTDRHNSTQSLFRAMFRLGQRWTFGSTPLSSAARGENRSTEPPDQQPHPVRVSDFFAATDDAGLRPSGTQSAGATSVSREKSGTALAAA